MQLEHGSRVAVIGGGPAGSMFAYFLLEFASRIDLEITVDIWEPKDFDAVGPGGCNHCGGIVSESLVQMLAVDGLDLPGNVVQRGIESYVMHTDQGRSKLETPLHEMRIAAVHRGGGPKNAQAGKFGSFDGYLLRRAVEKGARVLKKRVSKVSWADDHPAVEARGEAPEVYDLLVGAVGVNSAALKLFEELGIGYKQPKASKTYISELHFGSELIDRYLGNSMHVFLLDMPRIEFAAIIPKGEYGTLCILGDDIDKALVDEFLANPVVQDCLPPGWKQTEAACFCLPKINVGAGEGLWADRVVLIGDAGVARLYKDGIGAAYKTAKACAAAAIFEGIHAAAFQRSYRPALRRLINDNRLGLMVFMTVTLFKRLPFLRRGMLRMVEREQQRDKRPMSGVLWDTFTGSAAYGDILVRAMTPAFLGRLGWESFAGIFQGNPKIEEKESVAS